MQFLEFCKDRELISEESINTFTNGQNWLSVAFDASRPEYNDSKAYLASMNFSELVEKFRNDAKTNAAIKSVAENVYAAFFRALDEKSESTRQLIQDVDEYIGTLHDDEIIPPSFAEYFSKSDETVSANNSSSSEAEDKLSITQSVEASDENDQNAFEAFRNSFACQLEAIDKGLLDQYCSIMNQKVCDSLSQMSLDSTSYQDLLPKIAPELEVICSACSFVELPVSQHIFENLVNIAKNESIPFENFHSYLEAGLELALKVLDGLKDVGSECEVIADDSFAHSVFNWTLEGKV